MPDINQFERFLSDDGPAALVIREHLMPVEGTDGVLFPATYAGGDTFPGGYNIDGEPTGTNVCLIDSVGSQANRIEPLFAGEKYRHLIPQIVVKAGEKEVNILDAGHRAGDAIVRCSSLKETIDAAFLASIKGDAEPLARIAPTSLVFGVWNSRGAQGAQDKRPRLVASTIRAFNVRKLTRSAQFNPATEFVNDKLLDEPTDKATKDAYAERGFIHVPASGSHGGVIATGGIRRDATLGLAALRLLFAGKDPEKTTKLQRYILGLALVAFTKNPSGYLRQGCLLVQDPAKASENEFVEVHPSGKREGVTISHEAALKYATATAEAFGVAKGQTVPFDTARAKRDVTGGATSEGTIAGMITAIGAGGKNCTIKQGIQKIKVGLTDSTAYFKGDAASTIDEVVKKDVAVEVEVVDGKAVKVTAK
ncbi:MAG TPA: type I-U CRISPR-associated RAMP protein Csb1/Cas7u [Gemmataceae bacterium]|nr:type I-U CRISPR-associated RAMP protein Csb1/Cas7u [Gemmataceae bacterium]